MVSSRRLVATSLVPLAVVVGVYACGGRVADDTGPDAGTSPTGTTTPTGTTPTGTTTPTTPTTPPTTPTTAPTPSADAGAPRYDAGSEFSLDVTGCVARADTCPAAPSGVANDAVDAWLKKLLAGCASAPPNCGSMKIKFSRLPDFGACGQTLTFSVAQPVDFIMCLEKELSVQRCSYGLWVGSGADVDSMTIDLCR